MTELEQLLIDQITHQGPITFCDFMRQALYHPAYGYYNDSVRIGKAGGDFFTNADVHPLFGAVLAEVIRGYLQELPAESPKTIIECGAGTGRLAVDLLTALEAEAPELFSQLEYCLVEQSPRAVATQQEALRRFRQARWRSLAELAEAPVTGVLFSNELTDALPVHRVRWRADQLEEQFVGVEQNALTLYWQEPSTPELAAYLARQEIKPIQNQVIEINLAALQWLGEASAALAAGVLLTIDYGDTAERLYSHRPAGTLRCFTGHTINDNPLHQIGRQDITASVNFTALMNYGRDYGLEVVELTRQADWLMRNGIVEQAACWEASGVDTVAALQSRQALKQFLLPGGISDNFKVLVQRK